MNPISATASFPSPRPALSIVVIARNEEEHIGATLESVIRHTADIDREIIVVDSDSSDRTVAMATRYPVTIVELPSSEHLSPSAGRYAGTRASSGETLLFVDGDMILCDGWIRSMMDALADPGLAGVSGILYWIKPGEPLHTTAPYRSQPGEQSFLGGAAAYRRGALEAAGTFHPFLRGEEERELGYRLRRKGYRLRRIDAPMAYHMAKPRTRSEVEEKARYFTGVGQIMRRYGISTLTADLLIAQREMFGSALLLIGWLPLLAVLLLAGFVHLASILAGFSLAGLLGLALYKRPGRVILHAHGVLLSALNWARGIRRGLPSSAQFDSLLASARRSGAGSEATPPGSPS
jgi:cellulose synthase/poly-beta-1,6-N-acetylglucosamine synthase-like glycosyltransferase